MQLKQLFGQTTTNDKKTEQTKELTDSFVQIEDTNATQSDLEKDFVSIEKSITSLPNVNLEKHEPIAINTTTPCVEGSIDVFYQDQHYQVPRSLLPKESNIEAHSKTILDENAKPYASPIEGKPHIIVQESKSNIGVPSRGIGHVLSLTDDQKEYGTPKNIKEDSFKHKYETPYASSLDGQGYAASFSTNIPYGFSY